MRIIWILAVLISVCAEQPVCAQEQKAKLDFETDRQAVLQVTMTLDSTTSEKSKSRGTGFLISGDGFALTAKHVIAGYKNATDTPLKVRIGALDGREVEADPVDLGIGLDVALLKLRDPRSSGLKTYAYLQRGTAGQIAIGDNLYVIGFNFSSNVSLASGILGTNFGGGVGGNLLWSVNAVGAMFGMSGAPVFSTEGYVVGIVEGGLPGTGIVQIYPEGLLEPFAGIPHWTKVITGEAAPAAVTVSRDVSSSQVNFGCDQTLNVETPPIYFGKHPRNVHIEVAWMNSDNVKAQNQSTVEIKDPSTNLSVGLKGVGSITGLDSQAFLGFKNCPGGGHGELKLHVTWVDGQ